MNVETPLLPLIIINKKEKLEKYCVKIKFLGDLTSQKPDVYELKMALFDNGNMEEFLLFVSNFNMNIEASGTLVTGANIQYLHMLVGGE